MTQKSKRRILAVLLLTMAWCAGLIGTVLVQLSAIFTPCAVGKYFELKGLSFSGMSEMPPRYAVVRISSERLNRIVEQAGGMLRFAVPPGIIRNGLSIAAIYKCKKPDGSFEPLSVYFVVDDAVSQPFLSVRFPRDLLNEILHESDTLGRRSREKEWAFGHYELINSKSFDTLELYSLPVDSRTKVLDRRLVAEATGWVRYRLEENLLDVQTTARVSELVIQADVHFEGNSGEYSLSHKAAITKLRGNFNNVARSLDKEFCDLLRDSLEMSLNKESNRKKLSKVRFPEWAPIDINIDLKIVP